MVVVVFLLLCGLHNEAANSKFRNGRQYRAHLCHPVGKESVGRGELNDLCKFMYLGPGLLALSAKGQVLWSLVVRSLR